MNLGIDGRTAIVCGSSRGLGLACATALAGEGVNVVLSGRDAEALALAVAALTRTARGGVSGVRADVTTPEGQQTLSFPGACLRGVAGSRRRRLSGTTLSKRRQSAPTR